jgi:hypothetical protein
MRIHRSRLALPALVALTLIGTPLLAGCSFNPVQSVVSGVTGGKVDVGGTTVPKDFPKAVPLYKGTITSAAALGDDSGKVFNITMEVPDATAMADIQSQLKKAGLTVQMASKVTKTGGSIIADSADYAIAVVLVKDGKKYVVNYTVTPKPKDDSK